MGTLPPLAYLKDSDASLSEALSVLLEPSPILFSKLVPELHSAIVINMPSSYSDLIHFAISTVQTWTLPEQAAFVSGHPRIGENRNLSNFSAQEQAAQVTSRQVIARLLILNACYEHVYPGLRYITFVNGRSKEAIKNEMEDVLGIEHSLSPIVQHPPTVEPYGEQWTKELERAVADVGKIAISRLWMLGVT